MRRSIQLGWISATALTVATASIMVGRRLRRAPTRHRLAVAGLLVLLAFTVVRAASLHGVDAALGIRIFKVKLNWIPELGGIGLIVGSAAVALAGSRISGSSVRPGDRRSDRTGRTPGF